MNEIYSVGTIFPFALFYKVYILISVKFDVYYTLLIIYEFNFKTIIIN